MSCVTGSLAAGMGASIAAAVLACCFFYFLVFFLPCLVFCFVGGFLSLGLVFFLSGLLLGFFGLVWFFVSLVWWAIVGVCLFLAGWFILNMGLNAFLTLEMPVGVSVSGVNVVPFSPPLHNLYT